MAASGLTFLQIINRVLARLREEVVAAHDSTDYSSHIGQVVNQVKTEIEAAWQWHALRNTFDVATQDQVSGYALADTGMNAVVLSGWNYTRGLPLARGSNKRFDMNFFGVGSSAVQTGSPAEYVQAGLDASYDIRVDVWPVPITGYLDTLKFQVYVPQVDLAANGDIPLVPQNVLIEETVARMKQERGDEDMAQAPVGAFLRNDLLSDAIMRDAGTDMTEFDWEPE